MGATKIVAIWAIALVVAVQLTLAPMSGEQRSMIHSRRMPIPVQLRDAKATATTAQRLGGANATVDTTRLGEFDFSDASFRLLARLPLARAVWAVACDHDIDVESLPSTDGDCPMEGGGSEASPAAAGGSKVHFDWHGVASAPADKPLWSWEQARVPEKVRASWEVLSEDRRQAHGLPLGIPRGSCPAVADQPAADAALPPHLRQVGRAHGPDASSCTPDARRLRERWEAESAPAPGPNDWEPLPCISDAVLLESLCGRTDVSPDLCPALTAYPFLRSVARALLKGRAFPSHPTTVPVWGQLLFLDADHAVVGLSMIDVPVRQFVFVQNMGDKDASEVMAMLGLLPWGVEIIRSPGYNMGYSASVNTIILEGIRVATDPTAEWFFLANSDVRYPAGALAQFAFYANAHWREYGLFYMDGVLHHAFGVSRRAVDKVGLFDEAFYPAYMEDIDYHWRVRLCGLGQIVTGGKAKHCMNASLKKRHLDAAAELETMRGRTKYGFTYGTLKWGGFDQKCTYEAVPPSGYTTPFYRAGPLTHTVLPLSAWAVDPRQYSCVTDPSLSGRAHCSYDPIQFLHKLAEQYDGIPTLEEGQHRMQEAFDADREKHSAVRRRFNVSQAELMARWRAAKQKEMEAEESKRAAELHMDSDAHPNSDSMEHERDQM